MKNKQIAKITNKKDEAGAKFVWTKKRKIAAGIIGAGALSLIIFAIIIFVFDLGPLRETPRSEEEARVVGECEGYEVYYDELRYITLLFREELDAKYGKYDTLSSEKKAEYEAELDLIVREEIKRNYVILSLCEKYGVDTDSSEARSYVKEAIEDLVDELESRDKYAEWLKTNNLTDALVRFIYKTDYLEKALLEQLTRSGEVVEFTAANLDQFVAFVMEEEIYAKVIHVYYPREHFLYTDRGTSMEKEVSRALQKINSATSDSERYNATPPLSHE